jgi:hypothetical protein
MNEIFIGDSLAAESKSELHKTEVTKDSDIKDTRYCIFEAKFNDLQKGEIFERYICQKKAGEKTPYCAFHDKSKAHWDNDDYEEFRSKLNDCISDTNNKTPLCCIGYHFPMNLNFKHFS